MASRVGVLTAVVGEAEAAVVQGLSASRDLEVVRRCADLAELLGTAAAGRGRVAVVSTDLPGLDREAVAHLHGSGVRVVAVPGEGWDQMRAAVLGADAVVTDPEEVPGAVARVLAGAPEPVPERPPVATPSRAGALVAVWGPTGAPGRTTLAVNLAAELAAAPGRRRDAAQPPREVLLVDADTYGGTVAQVLGLLDEAPGIAAAARAAGTARLDAAALAALTPRLGPGLRVLTGLSRADRWPELPASSLEGVWPACRALADVTVVDCGFSIEQDEALTYDTRAPQRNAATLSALGAADLVVVVGAGDPVGLQRLVRALGALAELGLPAARRVVVNRVRASASGPRPAQAVRDALRRYAGVPDAVVLPEDQAACDAALLHGRTLAEQAPSSALRRAVARLAADVAGDLAAGAAAPVPATSDVARASLSGAGLAGAH
jgi:MinD-like ATPase involved in chromosome partitioning or flagellar assembly